MFPDRKKTEEDEEEEEGVHKTASKSKLDVQFISVKTFYYLVSVDSL